MTIRTVNISTTTIARQMRDDIRPTRRTFVFGVEVDSSMASAASTIVPVIIVSSPTSPTGVSIGRWISSGRSWWSDGGIVAQQGLS